MSSSPRDSPAAGAQVRPARRCSPCSVRIARRGVRRGSRRPPTGPRRTWWSPPKPGEPLAARQLRPGVRPDRHQGPGRRPGRRRARLPTPELAPGDRVDVAGRAGHRDHRDRHRRRRAPPTWPTRSAQALVDFGATRKAETRVGLPMLAAAITPTAPSSPKPPLELAVGAAAGLLVGGSGGAGRGRPAVGARRPPRRSSRTPSARSAPCRRPASDRRAAGPSTALVPARSPARTPPARPPQALAGARRPVQPLPHRRDRSAPTDEPRQPVERPVEPRSAERSSAAPSSSSGTREPSSDRDP